MALLTLLGTEPKTHGFALKRRYDELLGADRELKPGQVYATLTRLERDGLAEGVGFEFGGAAERRLFAITDRGVTEVDEWLLTPQLPGGRPSELFARVILALVSGRPAADILEAQRAAYLVRMREITGARGAGDVVDRLAGDYELAHLEADLRWIDLAGQRLRTLTGPLTEPGS